MSYHRLPRQERRDALLDAAWCLIADRGADALTLAEVARLGGVSKPVAYDHFGDRAGLLCALYERYYTRHIDDLERLLAAAGTLEAGAQTIATAYVDCEIQSGPVAAALSAAMKGTARMEAMKHDCDDRYLDLCRRMLTERGGGAPDQITLVGFLGAAASVAHHVVSGRLPQAEATGFLAGLLAGAARPAS